MSQHLLVLNWKWLPGFDPTKPQEEETVVKTNGAIKELREEVFCKYFFTKKSKVYFKTGQHWGAGETEVRAEGGQAASNQAEVGGHPASWGGGERGDKWYK